MCLAEALLRVPDAKTMDDLIDDKIAPHDWSAHSGKLELDLRQRLDLGADADRPVLDDGEGGIEGTLRAMVRRLGEPVIRTAVAGGDARNGRAVRARPQHRRGDPARPAD